VYYRIASTSTSSLLEAAERVLKGVAGAMAVCAMPQMRSAAEIRP